MKSAQIDNIGTIPLAELADRARDAGQDILMNPTARDREEIGYLFLCIERLARELADR